MRDLTHKNAPCLNCKRETKFVLHIHFSENGAQKFLWVCPVCNRHNPAADKQHFIPKELIEQNLTPEQIKNLPPILPPFYARCSVCGERGVSEHHWAPKSIFGKDEAEKWPKDFLCIKHHCEWHSKVTPGVTFND